MTTDINSPRIKSFTNWKKQNKHIFKKFLGIYQKASTKIFDSPARKMETFQSLAERD